MEIPGLFFEQGWYVHKIGNQHLQLYNCYKRTWSTAYTAEQSLRTISLEYGQLNLPPIGFPFAVYVNRPTPARAEVHSLFKASNVIADLVAAVKDGVPMIFNVCLCDLF